MIPLIGVLALVTLITLACLVARAGTRSSTNKLLATLLVLESLFLLHVPITHPWFEDKVWASAIAATSFFVAAAIIPWTYLRFLAPLDTPIVRHLRRPGFERLARIVPAIAVPFMLVGGSLTEFGILPPAAGAIIVPVLLFYVSVLVFALACAISAWRIAAPGTLARKRAGGFALAFGLRDAMFIMAIYASFAPPAFLVAALGRDQVAPLVGAIAAIVYGILLAYVIMRTQLFDLDLRIKWGISRGTVAGIILVAVFVVAKVVESYLNRTVGFVAGSVVAGALLFLVPKLNKVGEKVANTALPQVQPTSEYLVFKKLEVYRAAVEGALETGNEIDASERHMLTKLRAKLGLSEQDAQAIEAELASASS